MIFACLKKKNIIITLVTAVAGVLAFILLSATEAHTVFYGGTMRKLPIYSVQTDEKKIAISFDCAWGVDYTDTLLSVMESENVKCTFFMVEFWTEKYPEYVKKIHGLCSLSLRIPPSAHHGPGGQCVGRRVEADGGPKGAGAVIDPGEH